MPFYHWRIYAAVVSGQLFPKKNKNISYDFISVYSIPYSNYEGKKSDGQLEFSQCCWPISTIVAALGVQGQQHFRFSHEKQVTLTTLCGLILLRFFLVQIRRGLTFKILKDESCSFADSFLILQCGRHMYQRLVSISGFGLAMEPSIKNSCSKLQEHMQQRSQGMH